jgi:hypothetical protein
MGYALGNFETLVLSPWAKVRLGKTALGARLEFYNNGPSSASLEIAFYTFLEALSGSLVTIFQPDPPLKKLRQFSPYFCP